MTQPRVWMLREFPLFTPTLEVVVDGVPLGRDAFAVDASDRRVVSLAAPIASGRTVTIHFR
jgi:hypothetical protein